MSILSYFTSGGDFSLSDKHQIVVYTDGSCFNNGRGSKATGGLGVVFPEHPELNLSEPLTGMQATNNRAEMLAIIRAIQIIHKKLDYHAPILIKTDSMLCMKTVNDWMKTWKSKGWKKADGQPPKNLDLLKTLDTLLTKVRHVKLQHVAAHTGRRDCDSKFNDMADRLARAASSTKRI